MQSCNRNRVEKPSVWLPRDISQERKCVMPESLDGAAGLEDSSLEGFLIIAIIIMEHRLGTQFFI